MTTHPIIREPADDAALPVVLSIPHYGCEPLPGIGSDDYAERRYRSFRFGYADAYAAELYGDLHAAGPTVIASQYSRLFLDLNRRRDDFECEGGEVRSQKGVFRTHTIHDKRVLAAPLSEAQAEARLEAYYDPYYTAVKRHAGRLQERFTNVVIVDGHTGSPRRLEGHAIVLGTGRGKYCDPELAALAAEVLESHGFDCTLDLSGYRGGAVVRHFGTSRSPRQAIQVEVNAGLIMRCSRRAYAESLQQGLPPAYDREVLAELRAAMTELLRAIGQYVQA